MIVDYKSKEYTNKYLNVCIVFFFLYLLLFFTNFFLFVFQRNFMYKFKNHEHIEVYDTIKDVDDKDIDIYLFDNNSDTDLIFIHGSLVSGKTHKKILEAMSRNTGYNVISYYFRGMNNRRGQPTEKSIMKELDVISEYIKKRGKKNVVYGQSLGCSVAISLSNKIIPKCLILENPFITYLQIVKNIRFFHVFSYLLIDRWNNIERIKEVDSKKTSVLFLVSEEDQLVNNQNSYELSSYLSQYELKMLKGSDHFKSALNPEYYEFIRSFLVKHL